MNSGRQLPTLNENSHEENQSCQVTALKSTDSEYRNKVTRYCNILSLQRAYRNVYY